MRKFLKALDPSSLSTPQTPPAPIPQKASQQALPIHQKDLTFASPPHLLIIGAGSRGHAYAKALHYSTNTVIACVADPLPHARADLGSKFIWASQSPLPHHEFSDWRDWVAYEKARRERERAGEKVERGVDAVVVCVLDELHREVVEGVCGMGVHVLCEKPLGTGLGGCVAIVNALKGAWGGSMGEEGIREGGGGTGEKIFGICHVLRYSPHNMLLRKLLVEEEVVGEVLSIEHVEPVGWWHFSHSYVRGNWRKESTTAPSLLTKSCHDLDFIMWMLCSPPPDSKRAPHLPSFITSTGSRKFFKKSRKPEAAGDATNCLSCPIERDCEYSAKNVYVEKQLKDGNTGWPVKIVNPQIEDVYNAEGLKPATAMLLDSLKEDYTVDTPEAEVEKRSWFGRCVFESDNDVCDDQCVTITWDDDPQPDETGQSSLKGRGAKTAQFHMVAFTEKICERRGRIYGTKGEIEYDSCTIKVHNFRTEATTVYPTSKAGGANIEGGHGGGDKGLAQQFVLAVDAVNNQGMSATEAQRRYLGCDLDEAFLSHAVVFAAEDARKQRKVVDWKQWWADQVEPHLHQR